MTKVNKFALVLISSMVITNCGQLSAVERTAIEPYFQDSENGFDDIKKQVLTTQMLSSLNEVKKIAETRSPRPVGTCAADVKLPEPPIAGGQVLQQLKCIVCQLKEIIGCVDHEGTYRKLLEAIECCCDGGPCTPQDFGDAIALLAKALTEILNRLGCPEGMCDNDLFPLDVFGDLCYISSQIDVLDSKIDTIGSNVEVFDSKIDIIESSIEVIDSKIDGVTSMTEIIESNIAECCTVIGSPDETVDCDFALTYHDTCDSINDTELSIVQWLKAIFLKCNKIDNCVCP
jgi:hypothetical protein